VLVRNEVWTRGAQASESKQRYTFRLTLSMADRSRPRTQREELAQSISSVDRAQQRKAERLREVEARAAHRAQALQSGATATTITRSVHKHIDQSTDQLQSVIESTRQPEFVDNLSGLHPRMPLPRTPVPKISPQSPLGKQVLWGVGK
jgi:ATP phosphoribosyltransferase